MKKRIDAIHFVTGRGILETPNPVGKAVDCHPQKKGLLVKAILRQLANTLRVSLECLNLRPITVI
jgi:hypothetical protein